MPRDWITIHIREDPETIKKLVFLKDYLDCKTWPSLFDRLAEEVIRHNDILIGAFPLEGTPEGDKRQEGR